MAMSFRVPNAERRFIVCIETANHPRLATYAAFSDACAARGMPVAQFTTVAAVAEEKVTAIRTHGG